MGKEEFHLTMIDGEDVTDMSHDEDSMIEFLAIGILALVGFCFLIAIFLIYAS